MYTALAGWLFAESIPSGMDLHHQCAGGVFLCLGSLETRETKRGDA